MTQSPAGDRPVLELPVLELRGAAKSFGPVRALRGTDFTITAGDVVGLVGHNGAGKSTLMNVIAGVIRRDEGAFLIGGDTIGADYTPSVAQRHGVRCVFQELSLCRNLDLAENTRMLHANLRGFGRRRRARRLIHDMLNDIFPEHGILLSAKIEELSLAERQMVEIARAYTNTDQPARFVILDEPTSSLGHEATAQLLRFIRRAADRGVGSILISHRLDEILTVCNRIVVMVDGQVVARRETPGLSRRDLVGMMGHIETPLTAETAHRSLGEKRTQTPGVAGLELPIEASAGEVVGFAGLDGHGQRERLRALFFAAGDRGEAAYVAGDRGTEGVFPLWSICENMTIRSIAALRKGPLISRKRERAMAEDWVGRMQVKTDGIDRLLTTLSGGNQQKVLFARALATDAPIIFLDDPMRGVDVGTKQEVYRMIRDEAAAGRCFVWFTSEIEEMANCDTVYVFHEQRANARLQSAEVAPARIVQASFGEGPMSDVIQGNPASIGRGPNRPSPARRRRINPDHLHLALPCVALLVMLAVIFVIRPTAFSYFGFGLLFNLAVPLILASMAQMLVICLGDIDLSVGNFVGFVTCVVAVFLQDRPLVAVLLLAAGIAAYAAVGVLIQLRSLPSIIVTLGMSFVWLGLALLVLPSPGGNAPYWLTGAMALQPPWIPLPIVIAVAAAALGHWLLKRSAYGVVLLGAGANPRAAARAGWSLLRARIVMYGSAGLLAVLSGLTLSGLTTSGDPNIAPTYTLLGVGAVILGGGSFTGGLVSPVGTVVGAMTLSLAGSLLSFLNVPPVWQVGAQGVILFLVLAGRVFIGQGRR